MATNGLRRVLAELSASEGPWTTARLCAVCLPVAGVDGAGIMLMSGDLPRGSVGATGEVSELIEEMQFTLGEGPCVDAFQQDRTVTEPDLADPVTRRWPAFTPPVLRAGARALFGFPLRIGAVRLGALDLYRDRPGPLTDEQHAAALVLAGRPARQVLEAAAGAAPGALPTELESGDFHFVVHNAAGMISVQLGITVADALIRMRAHAFSHDRLLNDLAQDVVDRKLRLG
jgi:hypothetical protein